MNALAYLEIMVILGSYYVCSDSNPPAIALTIYDILLGPLYASCVWLKWPPLLVFFFVCPKQLRRTP